MNLIIGKYFEQYIGLYGIDNDLALNLNLLFDLLPDALKNVVFSHDENPNFFRLPEQLKTNKKKYKKSKIIFLTRDHRDVIVSSYFEKTKRIGLGNRRSSWKSFNGTMSDYVYQKFGGIDSIIRFYNIWGENREVPTDFLLLKYEDLLTDTEVQFERLLKFIDLKIDKLMIKKAVEAASFKNMEKIERSRGTKSDKLKPFDINDKDSYKTRKGIIGDHKNHLLNEEIEYLTKKIENDLSDYFGY